MNIPKITLIFLLFIKIVFAQSISDIKKILKSKFENFDYIGVIITADSLFKLKNNLTKDDSLSIFYYKALSAFHLWDINLSEESFRKILTFDINFSLDSNEVSPKIISFFNQIKKRELERLNNQNSIELEKNYSEKFSERKLEERLSKYRQSVLRNLIYPGWGYFGLNEKRKGIVISSLFTLSLLSGLYFSYDTYIKEKTYLNETNPQLISQRYKSYNTVYKVRNITLLTLATIYIYSQIDILNYKSNKLLNQAVTIKPEFFNGHSELRLEFIIAF